MSLITALKISLAFIGKPVFNELGFRVVTGDRIGLVGPNGSGKTTLLRLLMGEIASDSGEVRTGKGARIGYLPQDVQESLSGPLLKSVLDSVPGRVRLENELTRSEESLKSICQKEKQAELAGKLAEIHHDLNHLELEFPRHKAEKILVGLGFETSDFPKPVSSLSGGWKTRAALASLLYQQPDLLLFDEPTNHLDIPSIRWLENYLKDFNGAMMLVSHDRDFLNRQINRVISFEPEGVRFYRGNYDFYLKARQEERISLDASTRKQEQKIKEAHKFIERFRAKATKARQAQSKLKLLRKMELVKAPRKEKTTQFSFPDVPRSGREVVSIKGVSKGFGGKLLYKDINLTVLRGERIAIIGPNGCGKTTLLRIVAGEIESDEGKILLGHGVSMAYFAQHHSEMLNPQNTVIQEVYKAVPNETIGFVRGVCGAFLFSGHDVDKATGVLSGGERARVSLAKLLVKPGNLMVMDEPTNHLDISSSETLIDALAGYNGTLLFVSHNQSFVNRLATKVWDIRETGVVEYPGNLNEYYAHVAAMEKELEDISGQEALQGQNHIREAPQKKYKDRKEEKRRSAEKRRLVHDTLKPILTEVQYLEGQISELESRQEGLEKRLADPDLFSDQSRSVPLMNEYSEVRAELEELILKWEQSHSQLESAKKDLGV